MVPGEKEGQVGGRGGEGRSGGGEIGERNHTSVLDCGNYLRRLVTEGSDDTNCRKESGNHCVLYR